MSFGPEEIDALARLSRLSLDDEERRTLAAELERVVGFVQQLQEVDVDGVEPMTHAIALSQRRRDDHILENVAGRRALAGSAGDGEAGVRVPRVVK